MNPATILQRSLKTRITLGGLAIFIASLWSLSLYARLMLRQDMERVLGEQQFSTVSMVSAQVNGELEKRHELLKRVAMLSSIPMQEGGASMQRFLERRLDLQALFNNRVFAASIDGTEMASVPPGEGIGLNHMDRDYIAAALREGKAIIGRPAMGKTARAPVVVMGAPVRDADGNVIGALSGVTNLSDPNFFDQITHSHYGKSGGYLLVAPQHGVIVTATDKSRIMETIPASGIPPLLERFSQGYQGYGVSDGLRGGENLVSAKGIPAAGWLAVAMLPTAEAFAPIREMQRRMQMATILLTLLALVIGWWMLKRQLSPLVSAAKALAASDSSQHQHPLPVARPDEIGQLVRGFNRLLKTLGQREILLRKIFDTSSVGIFLVDLAGRITHANQRMAEMFGMPLDALVGSGYSGLIPAPDRDVAQEELQGGGLDRLYVRADRTEFWGRLNCSMFHDENGELCGVVGVIADISERKAHEKQLEHIAHYDMLTQLPNRVLLADRLHQAMIQEQRRGQLLAVAYLDLDGFKAINDNYGHETGDQLLIALGDRMKRVLREGDSLARLGGDEFVAVLFDLPNVEACLPMLDRLLAAAAQPVQVGELTLQVSASLGMTLYPQADSVDADQLLRQADQAMYQAKLLGKNRYYIFDAEQDRSVRGHHEILERIRLALAEREFVLYYQPKVNMRTGKVIGVEALIRWQHSEKGLLPPAVFLPAIENHPLAVDVGEWVVDAALTQVDIWRAERLDIPVSVNIGARQLQQSDFVERLRRILAHHPEYRPGDLDMEVLESSALEDMIGVSQVIESCRELGVNFALDDFGTGYSSLTYLKRLPVSLLKIDQSFVRGMLDDPDDLSILQGVISLAGAFNRQVIAEGVETVVHGEVLLHLGCELGQGYGIARPMPASEIPGWIRDWRPAPAWTGQKEGEARTVR